MLYLSVKSSAGIMRELYYIEIKQITSRLYTKIALHFTECSKSSFRVPKFIVQINIDNNRAFFILLIVKHKSVVKTPMGRVHDVTSF